MSTPVDTTLTGLKESTAHIKAIICGARQIPLGPSHFALTSQVTGLVAQVVKEHGDGPLPGIVISCSKELMRVRSMSPQVWPDWFSIGHDNPCLLKHPWHAKVLAWEALGDDTFDLPVAAPPSTGPIPVDLPSPPVHASNVAGPSTNPTTEYQDKGKGKAVFADPEAEAEGSRKRKSLMILEPSSQPPKSVMKSHKCMRSTRVVKSKPFVESELEDDDQPMIKLFSGGVPEVVLPRLSTIIARTPNSPRSPRVPTKQPYGPATAIAGSRPAGVEPPRQTPEAPVQAPPVIDAGAILIPGPEQPMPGLQQARLALRNSVRQEDQSPVHVMCLLHDKEDQVHLCNSGIPAQTFSSTLGHLEGESRGTSGTPGVIAVTTPKTQMCGRSKTITAAKPPAPAPAPASLLSSSSAVPRAALNVPMPDLHAMAITIWDGAAQIALLEAQVAEQDGRFDTLQRLHESLRREIIDRHPSFPLPNPPANATTMLLDQSLSMSMSPPEFALPPLIDLSMAGMAPTPPTPEDASPIEGLVFEDNIVHPEDPHTSGEHVDPGNPGNLVPEYDSADDMDVEVKVEEVKVEPSSEETAMAT
ncbi:hypothetical protein EDB19DRAFT_1839717 [Suillus lakei]|nr:hypothetical protein EDB19DRAFT_1839717 [Suillus lakei]